MAKIRVAKPLPKALAVCYSGVISAVAEQRVKALFEATSWWEKSALAYVVMHRLTADQKSVFDKAAKARKLAMGSTAVGEQEQALRTACRLYEKLWAEQHKLPRLDDSYAEYEKRKDMLEAEAQKQAAKRAGLLDLLGRVFAPCTFEVAALADGKPQMIAGDGKVLLNHTYATELAHRCTKKGGELGVVCDEMLPVLKALSLTTVDGVLRVDATKALNAVLPAVLEQMKAALGGAAAAAVQPQVQKAASARAPKAAKTSSKDVVGVVGKRAYHVGTANAAVWTLLSDQQVHTLQEAYDASQATGAKYPKDALWFVTNDGKKTGAWTVMKDKVNVRMVVH